MSLHLSSGEPAYHLRESGSQWRCGLPRVLPRILSGSRVSSLIWDENWIKNSRWLFCGLALDHCSTGLHVPAKGWRPIHSSPPGVVESRRGEPQEQNPVVLDPTGYELEETEHHSQCLRLPRGSASFSALLTYFDVFLRGGFQMGPFRLDESGSGS